MDEGEGLHPLESAVWEACSQLPPSGDLPRQQRAASVALILRRLDRDLALCFAKRRPFEGDPWSGDMAFPGGKADPGDKDFEAIAQRETREEIGLSLSNTQLIGALPSVATGVGGGGGLLVQPLLFGPLEAVSPFQLNEEMEAAYWIPFQHIWDPRHQTEVNWSVTGQRYPGIAYEGQVIWGLTYRILASFAEALGRPLPRGFSS